MGKIVVITGGTSGIGLVLKNLFEQNGDTVITFSLEDTGAHNHYQGSIDHEIKVRQVFNDIREKYGHIDVLINGAGIGMSGITELADMEEIKRVMDVNFYGTLYTIRSALPIMSAGSKIINMSSAMALFPVPYRSIYGAAKAAVLNLSMSLRMELKPLGIDVIAICPGNTKTNFTKNRIKNFVTNDRYGDRLEIATLASDANEDKRMTAKDVGEKIFALINKPKSKPFYIIGTKYKFLHFLTRFTPKSLLINQTEKHMGGHKAPKYVKTKYISSINGSMEDAHQSSMPVAAEQSIIAEQSTPVDTDNFAPVDNLPEEHLSESTITTDSIPAEEYATAPSIEEDLIQTTNVSEEEIISSSPVGQQDNMQEVPVDSGILEPMTANIPENVEVQEEGYITDNTSEEPTSNGDTPQEVLEDNEQSNYTENNSEYETIAPEQTQTNLANIVSDNIIQTQDTRWDNAYDNLESTEPNPTIQQNTEEAAPVTEQPTENYVRPAVEESTQEETPQENSQISHSNILFDDDDEEEVVPPRPSFVPPQFPQTPVPPINEAPFERSFETNLDTDTMNMDPTEDSINNYPNTPNPQTIPSQNIPGTMAENTNVQQPTQPSSQQGNPNLNSILSRISIFNKPNDNNQ